MPRHYDEDEDDLYENPYAESDTDADDDDADVVENPASVVRTARDERLWRMAKASAARQGRAREWPYVMGIFQRMKHHMGGAVMNPDDDDDEDAPPTPPPTFQLRASAVQQPLFGAAAFESVPKPKKKLPPPVDTRQRDLFGLPIDDEPRENPDDYEVAIAYSARPSMGGWIPVVKQNGRVVSTFDPYLLYDKEVAVAIAHDFAQDLASHYVGDWNVSIVEENPRRRR